MRPPSDDDTSKEAADNTTASGLAPVDVTPPATAEAPGGDSMAAAPLIAQQPMSGIPLYIILFGICVGSFLMSTDVFIISTVSLSFCAPSWCLSLAPPPRP